jgi:hypothetical protein
VTIDEGKVEFTAVQIIVNIPLMHLKNDAVQLDTASADILNHRLQINAFDLSLSLSPFLADFLDLGFVKPCVNSNKTSPTPKLKASL